MTVNDIKVCEGLPVDGFPSLTSEGGRPVPDPAAGNGNGSNLNNTGSNGNYWSSTPNSDNSNNAWNLNFNSGNFNRNNNNRYNGQSVRPLRALATAPSGGTPHRLLEDLARYGVEFLGAFIKPFRTYVASRSLRRIRAHIHTVVPRVNRNRAQAVVNSSLGVLSHYDSYFVRKSMIFRSHLPDLGRISEDFLRYYPNVLDWKLTRFPHVKGVSK